MAELLYRLGKLAARRAWIVVVAWLAILGLAGGAFALFAGSLSSNFDIPGTPTAKVTSELAKKLPDFSGASGTIVFHTTDDATFTAAQKSAITRVDAGALKLAHVTTVVDPFEAQHERATQSAKLSDGLDQLRGAKAQLDAARAQLDAAIAHAKAAGVYDAKAAAFDAQRAELTTQRARIAPQLKAATVGSKLLALASGIRTVSADGTAAVVNLNFDRTQQALPAAAKKAVITYYRHHPIPGVAVEFSSVIAQTVPEVIGVGEITGVVLAGVVLFVMLGTLIAAGLPLFSALIGVGVGVLASLSLSSVVPEQSVTPVLGVMLGLAVGIDYSLFIINRHRTQLQQGMELHESIGLATGTAGNAVVFAGSTVIVALLALNVTGIPFLGVMGTVGAVCILVAVVIAVTFTPALLRVIGMRVLTKRLRVDIGHEKHVPGQVAPMSTVRAAVTAVLAIVVLLVIAVPAMSMRLGLPDASSDPLDSTTYRAFALTDQKFGEGVNGPLVVTAHLDAGLDDAAVNERELAIAQKINGFAYVKAVVPIGVSKDTTLVAFEVVPTTGPNSQQTVDLVRALRAATVGGVRGDLGVAGQASGFIDLSDGLGRALPIYIAIVIGLSIIILIGVFRSILVPLIATGGFILSLLATYGVLVAVFQFGWLARVFGIHSTGPVLNFLPIILVGILFGLAMDYQLFLATGMREAYVHGAPAREAVVRGFRAGRRVVIAAAIIMICVFGGFIFSDSVFIVALGLGLASGVLFDAFVVRMLLMPALMHLLGRSAWWIPRWLDRILPQLDVEGAKLEREHHAV